MPPTVCELHMPGDSGRVNQSNIWLEPRSPPLDAQPKPQVNAEVDGTQSTINEGVFGWVNSTSTLNITLNNFCDEVQDLVETFFGGTILE